MGLCPTPRQRAEPFGIPLLCFGRAGTRSILWRAFRDLLRSGQTVGTGVTEHESSSAEVRRFRELALWGSAPRPAKGLCPLESLCFGLEG